MTYWWTIDYWRVTEDLVIFRSHSPVFKWNTPFPGKDLDMMQFLLDEVETPVAHFKSFNLKEIRLARIIREMEEV